MKKFRAFIALDSRTNIENLRVVKKLYPYVYGFKVGYRSFYNSNSDKLIKEIKKKTQPSLIFKTRAEHMPIIWYQKFVNRPMESDPLFVIQSNNLFDVEEHVNCVHSVEHMTKKFPMRRLEYAGEKEMFGYKRFMVIGRP